MTHAFDKFVAAQKVLAANRGIEWDTPTFPDGRILPASKWNLSAFVGAPGAVMWLSDLGGDAKTLPVLNQFLVARERPQANKLVLSPGWQDLVKAMVMEQLLVRRNTPRHVATQIIRPLKVLGTCVQALSAVEPWDMAGDDVQFACEVAAKVQASGKIGELVVGVVKNILDAKHLCRRGPFHHLIKVEPTGPSKRGQQVLGSLSEHKRAELLPDIRALWELVRIVFTEKPRTFIDAIRFAQIRVMFICGFRVGEVCHIPLDWCRTKEHIVLKSEAFGGPSGVKTSLMIRHFAEKQQGRDVNSVELVESAQHVPIIFEQILADTLNRVAEMTVPLRERLQRQCETGRHLPEFDQSAKVDSEDLYVRLTGNPAIRGQIPDELFNTYRDGFQASVLEEIARLQRLTDTSINKPFYSFWLRAAEKGLLKRARYRIADVEAYVSRELTTKHSDTAPLPLHGGRKMQPYEMLFLAPKRALSEVRNDGVCDITRYFSVGLVTPTDIIQNLAADDGSIFARYGETEEDRALGLTTHSLRHLQNTELFRQGIADTIISKRFNRRSVAQSYEYDHRSLAEQLEAMELPKAARQLHPKARAVAGLIKMGKASGPVIDQFKLIQRTKGDDEAFTFLAGEADGFHATPYGFCINSFMVEPCGKHLQCFDGCKYLVACLLDRQRANLEKLRERMVRSVAEISRRPKNAGRDSQLKHAGRVIDNIEKLLSASEGDVVFSDGRDLSDRIGHNQGPAIDGIV